MKARLEKNILVISDLHLGEGIRQNTSSVSYLRRLLTLEKELCAFLRHYTTRRVGDRPWRLVVNGDMVDFMSIQIMPSAREASSAEERQYGLGYGEEQSVAKLGCVIERHRTVFQALGEFVGAGNELVVVVGNHDVEFHYPGVQARLVEALVELGAAAGRIRFCPWFYYEEEVVYVEHGHQYDEYCSFDYQLHPVAGAPGGMALSLAHAGMRYFTNLVPELDHHRVEEFGFVDYIKWGWAQGARGVVRVALFYATLVRKLIELSALLTDRTSAAVRADLHRRRLRELAESYRLAVEKLEALDGLRPLPALRSLFRVFVTLFIDRMLLGVVALLALVLVLALAPGWWKLSGSALLLGASLVTNALLARTRILDSAQLLRRAPEAIWRIVRAPFIVFGHSHFAETVPLSSGATYINTGSWAETGPERRAFTHLIISGAGPDGEPRAQLYQWRDGDSSPL